MLMEKDLWKTFIQGLDIELSEKGMVAPSEESIEDEAEEVRGMLLKVSFDVIMFMNHNQTKYYMMQSNQRLTQVGETTLREALLKYNKKQPRKRG
jgi:hypothetical protein